MPSQETERISNQVTWLYNEYRTALYNAAYYGKRLKKTKRLNFTIEAILALAAPGFIGTWLFLDDLFIPKILGLVASIVAVIKPLSSISDNLQRYTRLYTTYNEIAAELEQLVEKVRVEQDFSPETSIRFGIQVKRMGSLAAFDDPEMSPEEEEVCYKKVNEQIPADTLWLPTAVETQ